VSGKTVYESQGQQHFLQARIAAQAAGLVKVYGRGDTQVRALDGVSIEFPAGEFTGVMGPSGSGKSTLLHCMAALDQPTSGTVRIGETDVGDLNDRELTRLRRDRMGFIFQAFNLLPTLSALENIELPRRLAGEHAERAWLDTVIDTLGLRDRLLHRPAELSGGQQQRVAIARALAGKQDIIFADEPTGNLDSKTGAELLNFMRRSVDEFEQTIIMVTHDPGAAAYADRVVFLADGRVAGELRDPTTESVVERIKRLGA
jgi:putative ABC transport system ATP-binding protein